MEDFLQENKKGRGAEQKNRRSGVDETVESAKLGMGRSYSGFRIIVIFFLNVSRYIALAYLLLMFFAR